MKADRIKNIFLYGGVPKEEFASVRSLIWKRNRRTVRVTSLLSAIMGGAFLLYALFTRSGTWLPYFFLFCGSTALYVLNRVGAGRESDTASMLFCYAQMILVCVYAGILSTRSSNYAIPATSIVVFISLLPLSVDDVLVKMFPLMLTESAVYLIISRLYKAPEAFSLDVMNVGTFSLMGMVIYSVISIRNIREICQGKRIESIQRSIITSIAEIVEERDESTGGHITRTEDYVRSLVDEMKKSGRYPQLTETYCSNVLLAAAMHDVGKIKIPDAVLNKPGRLTDEEFKVIKRHSAYGAEMITKTMRGVEEEDYVRIAVNIARYHHERYDGRGYPDGLSGEAIPLEARIMALADVYDALVSERAYKKAFPKEKAVEIILEGSGTQFDPELVPLFIKCVEEGNSSR